MATSGSFNTTAYTVSGEGTRYLTFSWSRSSYSVENNTSTIAYTLKGNGTYTGWISTRNIKLTVNGTIVYQAAGPIQLRKDTVLKSGTITISHNSDGTKSFSAYAEAGIYYSAINSTGSGSWSLDAIPRKSSVSATNTYIGYGTTISVSRASTTFTHTLTWSCGNKSGTIATKTTAATVNWTVPDSVYETIPNAEKATVTITCTTYSGGTSLGSSACTFTAYAAEIVCKPTITGGTVVDTNQKSITASGDNTKIVRYVSNAQITGVSASVSKNAGSITEFYFTCEGNSSAISSGSATINGAESGTFTARAKDSRGFTQEKTYTNTLIPYVLPTITAKCERLSNTSGTIQATFRGSVYTSWPYNVRYRSRKDGGEWGSWVTLNAVSGTDAYSNGDSAIVLGTDFDYRSQYDFCFQIIDSIYDASTEEYTVSTTVTVVRGVPVVDWGENDFNFNVPLKYKGKDMDFVVEQGTSSAAGIVWNYRKWNSGVAECFGKFSTSSTHYKTVNSWYAYTVQVRFPTGLFNAAPVPSYSGGVGSASCASGMVDSAVTSSYMNCYALASSGGNQELRFYIHVKGTWK